MAGYGNYSFVIDSSFQPFTLQEMLVPFTAYKDVYEKSEEDYMKLTSEADKFKYLSETLPEDSKARQIYEGYANGLRAQAADLAQSGLTMGNRMALTDYKRRYQGEIGRLVEADTAMKAEKELRRKTLAQDPSMLYALENFNIDQFLDSNTPNLYGVSGNTLYAKGAAAGKADSSRVFSAGDAGSTLGGYYRDYVQKMGYNAETIAKFRQDMSTIPALQQRVDDILAAEGVIGNLTGESLNRARQQVINGIIDGAVYSETHNPQRDLGVMSATEKAADERARQGLALQSRELTLKEEEQNFNRAASGYYYDEDAKEWKYDPNKDIALSKAIAIASAKKASSSSRGNGSSTSYSALHPYMVSMRNPSLIIQVHKNSDGSLTSVGSNENFKIEETRSLDSTDKGKLYTSSTTGRDSVSVASVADLIGGPYGASSQGDAAHNITKVRVGTEWYYYIEPNKPYTDREAAVASPTTTATDTGSDSGWGGI